MSTRTNEKGILIQLRCFSLALAALLALFVTIPVMAQSPSASARIVERGIIKCFDYGLKTDEGDVLYCETSAAIYVGKDLILANDKPIPGKGRSPIFAVRYQDTNQQFSIAPIRYFTAAALVNARKYEGLTVTPDGEYLVATTAFDRKKEDSTEWDNFNTVVIWPVDKSEAAKVVSPSPMNGAATSVSLRKKFSRALKTLEFPDGVPYFKIEALSAIPGNRLLFGIREMGKSHEEFDYVVKIVSVSYTVKNDQMILGEDFRLVYDHNPAETPGIKHTVGLSGLEYDKYNNQLYLLTSFELENELKTDEDLGGYLWTLTMEDLKAKNPPGLVLKDSTSPLLFAHKPEGIAVLSENRVLVIHDDDRVKGRDRIDNPETQFFRKPHEAAYTIVEFSH